MGPTEPLFGIEPNPIAYEAIAPPWSCSGTHTAPGEGLEPSIKWVTTTRLTNLPTLVNADTSYELPARSSGESNTPAPTGVSGSIPGLPVGRVSAR
jgi:hypothetical protein